MPRVLPVTTGVTRYDCFWGLISSFCTVRICPPPRTLARVKQECQCSEANGALSNAFKVLLSSNAVTGLNHRFDSRTGQLVSVPQSHIICLKTWLTCCLSNLCWLSQGLRHKSNFWKNNSRSPEFDGREVYHLHIQGGCSTDGDKWQVSWL